MYLLNPFTHKVHIESIFCYSRKLRRSLKNNLKESCMASYQHFSLKCFPENAFVSKIFPKCSGLLRPP